MANLSLEEKTVLAVGLVSVGFVLIFLVHFVIVYLLSRKHVRAYKSSNNNNNVELEDLNDDDDGNNNNGKGKKHNSDDYVEFRSRRHYTTIIVLSTMALVTVDFTLLVLVMFDHLHIAAGIIIMSLISWTHFISFITPSSRTVVHKSIQVYNSPKRWVHRVWWKLNNKLRHWIPGFLAILCIILVLTITLEGTCEAKLEIRDTRIIRKYMKTTCETGSPCLVYLTLNKNPSTSIIANYHTSNKNDDSDSICRYDTISRGGNVTSYQFQSTGSSYKMPIEVTRYVHWVHLESLTPNTIYYFICGNSDNGWSNERSFLTAPDDSTTPFTFVVGGDIDITSTAEAISRVAAKQNPLFALVGGDLAYDRAQYTCYRVVDKWLQTWQDVMVTSSGLSIPIVASIGNHEAIGDYNQPKTRVPFFLRYFPQFTKQEDPGDGDKVDERPSYGLVNIGGSNGTVIFNLDSGHTNTKMSDQADWMKSQLEGPFKNASYKFSLYHVPMYPTYRDYSTPQSKSVRDTWMSTFDQYKFHISFENHDHAYKRTKPLKNDNVVANNTQGTIYMGDGAWGTGIRKLSYDLSDLKWYQAYAQSIHYILRIDITPTTITYKALDEDTNIFDQGTLTY